MAADRNRSPVADWVDLALIVSVVLGCVRLPLGEHAWAMRLVAAALFSLGFFGRRWLGLGPAPAVRSLGLAGALLTVIGAGLVIMGGSLAFLSREEPAAVTAFGQQLDAMAEQTDGDAISWSHRILESKRERAAECAAAGRSGLGCPSATELAAEEAAIMAEEQRRGELQTTRLAERAASSAKRDAARRADWPFGVALAGLGVSLIAAVSWLERRVPG